MKERDVKDVFYIFGLCLYICVYIIVLFMKVFREYRSRVRLEGEDYEIGFDIWSLK